jgi:uncharacterized coiled-coil protein SlyX
MANLEARVAGLDAALAERDARILTLSDRLRSSGDFKDDVDASAAENEPYFPLEVLGIIAAFLKLGSPTLARLAATSRADNMPDASKSVEGDSEMTLLRARVAELELGIAKRDADLERLRDRLRYFLATSRATKPCPSLLMRLRMK